MNLNKPVIKDTKSDIVDFDKELDLAIILNSAIRSRVLAYFFGASFLVQCLVIAWIYFYMEHIWSTLPKHVIIAPIFTLFAFIVEQYAFVYYSQHARSKKSLPWYFKYVTSFIEISIPTIFILFLADINIIEAKNAINSPALIFYFVFLILSALYLDFRVCVFNGIVVALEHNLLILFYFLSGKIDMTMYMYMARGILILITGVFVGYVAKIVKGYFLSSVKAKNDLIYKLDIKVKERTVEVVQQKEIIEQKNKDITDSIRYALNIQKGLLPKETEIKKILPQHFICFYPRDIVSGDFYWFAHLNGKTFIAACDCTGHGVPGAFVSMIGNDLLNQIIIEKGVEKPGTILTLLNNGIKSVFKHEGIDQQVKDGMDMVLCVFTQDMKTLEFAGAYNPLLLIQNGEMKHIKGDKHAIGGDTEKDYNFTNHRIDLQKGDTMYIFSDGYQDQFGGNIKGFGDGKKFMLKRFKALLLSIQDQDINEQKEILHKTIMDWKGNLIQTDDICVIGIRI